MHAQPTVGAAARAGAEGRHRVIGQRHILWRPGPAPLQTRFAPAPTGCQLPRQPSPEHACMHACRLRMAHTSTHPGRHCAHITRPIMAPSPPQNHLPIQMCTHTHTQPPRSLMGATSQHTHPPHTQAYTVRSHTVLTIDDGRHLHEVLAQQAVKERLVAVLRGWEGWVEGGRQWPRAIHNNRMRMGGGGEARASMRVCICVCVWLQP